MKVVGWMLFAAVVIAVAQALAAVMALALVAALIWALVRAPRETFGLLGLCVVVGLIRQQPLVCLGLFALAIVANAVARRAP